jgi:branched-chain amino acid transport system permease protein
MLILEPRTFGDYLLGLVVMALVAAAIGYLIERFLIEPGLARPGHSQLVITLGLGIVLQYVFQVLFPEPFESIPNPYPWGEAFAAFGVTISMPRIAAGVASLVLGVLISILVYWTRAGSIIRACAESLSGAMHVGVNVRRTYRLTFALGAACAAVAGGLLLPIQPVSPILGLELTIKAFVVVVIGGSGSLWGTAVAGVILGVAEALGSVYAPGSLATSLVYALFFLIILLRPQGIARRVARA